MLCWRFQLGSSTFYVRQRFDVPKHARKAAVFGRIVGGTIVQGRAIGGTFEALPVCDHCKALES